MKIVKGADGKLMLVAKGPLLREDCPPCMCEPGTPTLPLPAFHPIATTDSRTVQVHAGAGER
jgi:hypothetical protein